MADLQYVVQCRVCHAEHGVRKPVDGAEKHSEIRCMACHRSAGFVPVPYADWKHWKNLGELPVLVRPDATDPVIHLPSGEARRLLEPAESFVRSALDAWDAVVDVLGAAVEALERVPTFYASSVTVEAFRSEVGAFRVAGQRAMDRAIRASRDHAIGAEEALREEEFNKTLDKFRATDMDF